MRVFIPLPFVWALVTSGYFPAPPPPPSDQEMAVAYFQQGDPVTAIRYTALAAGHPELAEWAIRVGTCESGLRYAPQENPGHAGIMQQNREYWPTRSAMAGWPNSDPENPYINVYVSIKMVGDLGYSPTHWDCR